jgi:hypothetical protein
MGRSTISVKLLLILAMGGVCLTGCGQATSTSTAKAADSTTNNSTTTAPTTTAIPAPATEPPPPTTPPTATAPKPTAAAATEPPPPTTPPPAAPEPPKAPQAGPEYFFDSYGSRYAAFKSPSGGITCDIHNDAADCIVVENSCPLTGQSRGTLSACASTSIGRFNRHYPGPPGLPIFDWPDNGTTYRQTKAAMQRGDCRSQYLTARGFSPAVETQPHKARCSPMGTRLNSDPSSATARRPGSRAITKRPATVSRSTGHRSTCTDNDAPDPWTAIRGSKPAPDDLSRNLRAGSSPGTTPPVPPQSHPSQKCQENRENCRR